MINNLMNELKTVIKTYIEKQPQSIRCAECNDRLLVHDSFVDDKNLDMDITIYPCENCIKENKS